MHATRRAARVLLSALSIAILAVVAVGFLAVLVSCAAAPARTSSGTAAPAAPGAGGPSSVAEHPEDVRVGGCTRDPATGWPVAELTVTNGSAERSTYSVTVSFQSADGRTQYGKGVVFVAQLAPGQGTGQEARGFVEVPEGAAFECAVVSAKRVAAF